MARPKRPRQCPHGVWSGHCSHCQEQARQFWEEEHAEMIRQHAADQSEPRRYEDAA